MKKLLYVFMFLGLGGITLAAAALGEIFFSLCHCHVLYTHRGLWSNCLFSSHKSIYITMIFLKLVTIQQRYLMHSLDTRKDTCS